MIYGFSSSRYVYFLYVYSLYEWQADDLHKDMKINVENGLVLLLNIVFLQRVTVLVLSKVHIL